MRIALLQWLLKEVKGGSGNLVIRRLARQTWADFLDGWCHNPGVLFRSAGGRHECLCRGLGATYRFPYLVQPDDHRSDEGVLGGWIRAAVTPRPSAASGDGAIAFVDGVRRGEASLWLDDHVSDMGARRVAGGYACGCVLADGATRPEYGESRVIRLAIFGSGLRAALPEVPSGWRWQSASVDDTRAEAPLEDLQERMRIAEAEIVGDAM